VYRSLRRGGRPESTSFIVAPPAAVRVAGALEADAAGCTVALGCNGESDAGGLGTATLAVLAALPL
jgi:hypothetical protein